VEGEVIRVLDKGIILQLEQDVEGIIPITKLSKRDRKGMARKYKPGSVVSGVVMEVKPDDKKVILFVDDLTVDEKKGKSDDISDFLENQEEPASEKIEIPDALNQSDDEKSAEKEADKPEAED